MNKSIQRSKQSFVFPKRIKPKSRVSKLVEQYIKHKYLVFLFFPAVAYYVIFHYLPLYGIQIAFRDYSFVRGIWGSKWIGLDTFRDLFSMGSFWEVLRNTLILSIYKFIFTFPMPIIFAVLLNEMHGKWLKKITQTISYLPHFLSWVVLGGIFVQLLSPTTGAINIFLQALGLEPIYFLGDTRWFRTTMVATSVWKGFGWGSIVYLAALTGIDPTLYEAAYMDGASRFQRIRHITLPSLAPVVTIMLILSIGSIINDDFDQIFNLSNPAVYSVGDVLGTYTYRVGLVELNYSFGTAVGLFKNIIAFLLVMLTNSISKRISDYALW